MPRITLAIEPEELETVKRIARRRGRSVSEVAAQALREEIRDEQLRTGEHTPRTSNVAARRVAVAEYVRLHGFPEGLREKRALAKRLGVTDRTLYRDLLMVTNPLGGPPPGPPTRPKLVDGLTEPLLNIVRTPVSEAEAEAV